jgi:transcriptional regulator with XRE-family HTH domain
MAPSGCHRGLGGEVDGDEWVVIVADHMELGARIQRLRGKLLSQRELAEKAQVSVDLIRKLEQGHHTARVDSLQRIARAVDVTIAELLDQPHAMPSADPAAGVVAIRQALTPVDDLLDLDVTEGAPLTLDEADRTVTYLWGTYCLQERLCPGIHRHGPTAGSPPVPPSAHADKFSIEANQSGEVG